MIEKKKLNLKIYNSFTKKKEIFRSLDPHVIKMYCCGPTVYDFLHIGNFRGAVFYNFLRNYLEYLGYQVNYVYNFTDIDDKILNRANEENKHPKEIAEKYIKEFEKDYRNLKLKPHTKNPKATEIIEEIILLIEALIKNKKAYQKNGDVFYLVDSFSDYGNLSGRSKKDLMAGYRLEINENKRNPLDFSLWKKSKEGESWSWNSPWSKGRPGWHIECTAMIHKYLGTSIDIHGGGTDLIFPHHENEIAQSESFCSRKYVRYWIHHDMIRIKEEKMSKSLGNQISMREFLNKNHPELFKYLILSSHYRSLVHFTEKNIHQANHTLIQFYSNLKKAHKILKEKNANPEIYKPFLSIIKDAEEKTKEALDDDLNTPKAFSNFFLVLKNFQFLFTKKNTNLSKGHFSWCASEFLKFFKKYGEIFSLFQEDPEIFLKDFEERTLKKKNLSREKIEQLIKDRELARKKKDFKLSDKIRKELNDLGIEIQDDSDGNTSWEFQFH